MRTVIHFSGFVGDNDIIIVKELAIVHPFIDSSQSWLFKPPYPLSNLSKAACHNNLELTNHIFGYDWQDGDVEYKELKTILSTYTASSVSLYTYGAARQTFLQDILQRSIIDLEEDLQCPKFSKLAFPARSCAFPLHKYFNFRCALRESWLYGQFLKYQELASYVLCETKQVYNPTSISDSDVDQ